jgi:hypothetical protein
VTPRLVAAVPDLLGLVARPWEVIKEVVLLSLLDVGVTAETRLTISGSVCLANLILLNHSYKASASRIEVLRYLEKATMCSYSSRLAL